MPKHLRAKSALLSGADLVLELRYALPPVQSFCWGLSLCLTVWDVLTPSASEASAGDSEILEKITKILSEEPDDYKKHFKMLYAKGCHSHRQGRLLSLNISDMLSTNPDRISSVNTKTVATILAQQYSRN